MSLALPCRHTQAHPHELDPMRPLLSQRRLQSSSRPIIASHGVVPLLLRDHLVDKGLCADTDLLRPELCST
jgi:hypothetical protein